MIIASSLLKKGSYKWKGIFQEIAHVDFEKLAVTNFHEFEKKA